MKLTLRRATAIRREARHLALLVAAFAALTPVAGAAPGWQPTRQVTLVVPYGAGGGTDAIARAVARQLAVVWGQPVIVENVPGANGLIGTQRVINAKPDGHTLLLQVPGIVLTKYTPGLKGIDPLAQLEPVSVVAEAPNALVASARVPARTLPDFLVLCRTKPTCSLATVDNAGRVLGLQLGADEGMPKLVVVSYRGAGGAMVTDLVANNVDFALSGLTAILPHHKSGAVNVLATLGDTRPAALPDVPTAAQAGLKHLRSVSWVGMFAPKGTPPAVATGVVESLREAVKDADVRKAIETTTGGQAVAGTSAAFAAQIAQESERFSKLARRFPLE